MDDLLTAYPLTSGTGSGPVVALQTELSFWGGVDTDGVIIDAHHPDRGRNIAGSVLVMAASRGSSSSSSVLAELIRAGAAPVAIVLARPDPIVVLGALVADELYGIAMPIVTVPPAQLTTVAGMGRVTVVSDPEAGVAAIRAHHAQE